MRKFIDQRLRLVNRVLEQQHRSLLIALIVFIVMPSSFRESLWRREVEYACLSVVLFLGIYAVHTTRRNLIMGLALATIVIIIKIMGLTEQRASIEFYIGSTLYIVFYGFVAYRLLLLITKAELVSSPVLLSSIIVYLLFGIIGGFVFMLLENAMPGSLENLRPDNNRTEPGPFIYFSFITLTTLGYGDIIPVSAPARAMAILLAVLGPIYLTVLVAMLVGRYISHQVHEDLEDHNI